MTYLVLSLLPERVAHLSSTLLQKPDLKFSDVQLTCQSEDIQAATQAAKAAATLPVAMPANSSSMPTTCSLCDKPGHTVENCW